MKYMENTKMKYHVLVRGVILSGEYILIAHCIGMENTFLPGGHAEFHEGIKTTLTREIDEELGLTCEVNEYLGSVEAEFNLPEMYHQEINHLFLVTLPGKDHNRNPESKESHLEFYWIHIDEMENHNLQPYPVRRIIKNCIRNQEQGPYWLSTFDETNK